MRILTGSLSALCLSLAACSFAPQIADHAVAYNETIEQAENAMLLKNVLRASQHYPMQFTRISTIGGSLSGSVNGDVTAPFGSDADDAITPKLTLSASSKPTYTVKVLDTQEFFNGFLTPIAPELFRHLDQSGWDASLLMQVLVDEVWLHYANRDEEITCRISRNDAVRKAQYGTLAEAPATDTVMSLLGQILEKLHNYDIAEVKDFRDFGPALTSFDTEAATALSALVDKGYRVRATRAHHDGRPDWKKGIQISGPGGNAMTLVTAVGASSAFKKTAKTKLQGRVIDGCKLETLQVIAGAQAVKPSEIYDFAAKVDLRSPNGVFRALGKMVRDHDQNGFVVETGETAPDHVIATTFNGRSYWIPAEGEDGYRSRQMLALARLVFSLQTSSKDSPRAGVVRFIQQ